MDQFNGRFLKSVFPIIWRIVPYDFQPVWILTIRDMSEDHKSGDYTIQDKTVKEEEHGSRLLSRRSKQSYSRPQKEMYQLNGQKWLVQIGFLLLWHSRKAWKTTIDIIAGLPSCLSKLIAQNWISV